MVSLLMRPRSGRRLAFRLFPVLGLVGGMVARPVAASVARPVVAPLTATGAVTGAARSTPPGPVSPVRLDTAVVAGGCFWGVQGVYEHVRGVVSAVAGYAGGTTAGPTYAAVSTGRTGHAEAVQVVYDPRVVSYAQLLDVFFAVAHDPTTRNRQGPDVGSQYRSAVFVGSPAQRATAVAAIQQWQTAHPRAGRVVTEVVPSGQFTPAEDYHQHYLTRHPDAPYIVVNDAPKLDVLRATRPALWRP